MSKIMWDEAAQIQCYGCTQQHILNDLGNTPFPHIYIMGVLSDVQEAMRRGEHEMARQWINKAKFLIDHKYSPFKEMK